MNPSLAITVLVLLSGFALLFRRLRRAGTGRAPAWAFVLAACVTGLILGAMATGVSTLHAPSWKWIAPLICDGRVEGLSRTSSYQAPMSHTHDAGLTTVSTMLYCVDATGARQPVTGRFMAVSTLVYGGVSSLLLLWLFTRRRRSAARADNPATTLASTTFVTVNGQRVDADVAEKVQQLARRLVGSPTGNDASDMVRDMFQTTGVAQADDDLDARLRQLKHLYEQRLITDADYAMAKAELLSRL